MGNSVDCCYATRQYNQCVFPCIRTCSYTNRRVWYNFDGLESVQPLIDIFKPQRRRIYKFPDTLVGISDDAEIAESLKSGLDPPAQLAAICRYASNNGYRIRAVGTGSSWSRLTSTRDILIDMRDLNRILTLKPIKRADKLQKKPKCTEIEVEGGMQVVNFVEKLDKSYGLGLPIIGNYAGQTVAGVASTSTHGSSYFVGTLSTAVVAFHLVISSGIQVKLRHGDETFEQCQEKITNARYGDAPVEVESTEVFRAVAVGLGSLGIIYSLTYKCVPVYNIEEKRALERIPWPRTGESAFRVKDKYMEIFEDNSKGEFFSLFVNPYPQTQGYLYGVSLKGKRTDRKPTCCACCSWWCFKGGRGCAEVACLQTNCTASCLQTCASCCPSRVRDLTNFAISQFVLDHPFVQKWYNVLQFTKGNIHIRTAEFCLPLAHLDEALRDLIEISIHYKEKFGQFSLLPIYVRLVKTDDLYLSPANRKCPADGSDFRDACYVEVAFLPGAFGIEEFHKTIEDVLFTKYKARPHWGKNHHLSAARVIELYPDLEQWKKVFKVFNATGIFCNEFTHNMGFDAWLENLVIPRMTENLSNGSYGLKKEEVITVQPLE